VLIEANLNAYNNFIKEKPDIVFNIAEGSNGISRESQIPAMLDLLNIPYTASDPLTLATCLNKARSKEILSYYGIPNSKFRVINSKTD
jgi:D-alanine-D-alanine ligase